MLIRRLSLGIAISACTAPEAQLAATQAQPRGGCRMICCTRMVTPAAKPESAPRRIELDRAEIQADGAQLRRTAHFTDGTIRAVTINWQDVKRVVAFRRDVQASAIVSIAVTDLSNVVVLDEHMDGWNLLIEFLAAHLALAPTFAEWRGSSMSEPLSSQWTILFRA